MHEKVAVEKNINAKAVVVVVVYDHDYKHNDDDHEDNHHKAVMGKDNKDDGDELTTISFNLMTH